MKKIVNIIVIVLACCFQANAEVSDPKAIFQEANQFFDSLQFEKALNTYEMLIDEGFESKELYYNLGNTYYRMKQYPLAILNYERALKLHPKWNPAVANVKLSRTKIADKQEKSREGFSYWLTSVIPFRTDVWTWLGVLMLFSSLIAFVVNKRTSSELISKITRAKHIGFLVLFVLAITVSGIKYHVETSSISGIVVAPSLTVKSTPDFSSESSFVLHEGAKVIILETKEDWCNIRFGANEGWIDKNQISLI